MLFSYHLLYFCTALSLIIMLSSHYHHHKSKTFSQLTQCPFTGTLLLFGIQNSTVIYSKMAFVWTFSLKLLFERMQYFENFWIVSGLFRGGRGGWRDTNQKTKLSQKEESWEERCVCMDCSRELDITLRVWIISICLCECLNYSSFSFSTLP